MTIARADAPIDRAGPRAAPQRVFWLDFAKAFGIVLVCLGHTINGLAPDKVGAGLQPYGVLRDLIYTFHMPLFFVLSGVLAGFRPVSSVASFVRTSAIGILLPYALWSVAFVGLQNAFSGSVNAATPLSELAEIWWKPVGLFWFFYALFVARTAYFLAQRAFGLAGMAVLLVVFAALYGLSFTGFDDFNNILMGGSYFGIGVVAAPLLARLPDRRRLAAVLVVAAAGWAATATALLDPATPRLLLVPAALLGIAMTVAAARLLPAPTGSGLAALALLGQASLAIYVAHVMFSAATRAALYRLGVLDPATHVLLGTSVGVIAPALLFVLANRAGIAPFIGFGSTQKQLYWPPRSPARATAQ